MSALERRASSEPGLVAAALKWSVGGAIAVFTLATFYVHEAYVLKPNAPQWAHLAPFRWWLLPHVLGGAIALLLSPLQFSSTLRRRHPALHRWAGRIYMGAVIVSASLSIYIVLAFEAPVNWAVMGTMGGLWLLATVFAWIAILNRNVVQHQLWIGRSFCLTLTFVATRFVPDVILPGLDYANTTALYWGFIMASLIIPDLVVNGRALAPGGGKTVRRGAGGP